MSNLNLSLTLVDVKVVKCLIQLNKLFVVYVLHMVTVQWVNIFVVFLHFQI